MRAEGQGREDGGMKEDDGKIALASYGGKPEGGD